MTPRGKPFFFVVSFFVVCFSQETLSRGNFTAFTLKTMGFTASCFPSTISSRLTPTVAEPLRLEVEGKRHRFGDQYTACDVD